MHGTMKYCEKKRSTLSKMPYSRALTAGTGLPVVIISMATLMSVTLGNRWVPSAAGRIPSKTSGNPTLNNKINSHTQIVFHHTQTLARFQGEHFTKISSDYDRIIKTNFDIFLAFWCKSSSLHCRCVLHIKIKRKHSCHECFWF